MRPFISMEKGVRMSSIITELTTEAVRAARAHILQGFTVFPSIYAVCDVGIHGLVGHDALDALEAEDAVLTRLAARGARAYVHLIEARAPSVEAMDVAQIMPSLHNDREEVLLAITVERGVNGKDTCTLASCHVRPDPLTVSEPVFGSADDRVLGAVSNLLPSRDAPPLRERHEQVILAMVERRSRHSRSPNATVH